MNQFYVQEDIAQVENAPTYAVVGKKAEAEFRQTGKTDGGFAVLDKDRVTFGGKCFVKKGRDFDEQRVNWTASVNEIVGCSYTRHRSVYHLILTPLFLLTAIVGPILILVLGFGEDGIPLVALMAFAVFSFLGVNALIRFIRSGRAFFEIQLDGVSFCYDTRFLEKDEEIPFRLAIKKARSETPILMQQQISIP